MQEQEKNQLRWLALVLLIFGNITSYSLAADIGCDRDCLLDFTHQFNTSLENHDPTGLPLAENFRSTQNHRELPLGEGIWQSAGKIQTQFDLADPQTGQVATIGFFYNGDRAAYFVSRLKVVDRLITESEFLLVHRGETGFFALTDPTSWDPFWDQIIPDQLRTTRAGLIEIADQNIGELQGEPAPLVKRSDNLRGGENGYGMGQTLDVERGEGGPPAPGDPDADPASLPRMPDAAVPSRVTLDPELLDNSADPSIGKPELPEGRQWMRERRFPLIDEERGLILSYFLMGGRPAKPGDVIDWDKYYGQPKVVDGEPMHIPNRATYRIFLLKVQDGVIEGADQYEVELPPYVTSGF